MGQSVYIPVIVLALVLNTVSCTTLSPGRSRNPANAEAEHEGFADFKEFLAKRIVHLDRDLMTFRYDDHEKGPFAPKAQVEVQKWIIKKLERFADPSKAAENAGPGAYVALDPASSREYGGRKPQLYVIVLAKGTAVIDVFKPLSASESATVADLKAKTGCTNSPYSDEMGGWFAAFRNNDDENCRRMAIRAVQQLNIGAIMFDHNAGSSELEGCRRYRRENLNIVSAAAILSSSLAYYGDEDKIDSQAWTGHVSRLYDEAFLDPRIQETGFVNRPASLQAHTADTRAYENWKQQYIHKCGPKWATENDADPHFVEKLYSVYQDADVVREGGKFFRAFRKRFPERSLRLLQLRKVEELMYGADGLSAPFGEWQKAKSQYLHGSDDDAANAARILGEKLVRLDSKHVLESAAKVSAPAGKALLPAVYFSMEYGPRQARISLNELLLSLAAVPYLTGDLPRDVNQDVSALTQLNKTLFIDALKECTRIYQDNRYSNQDIDRSACAVSED